METVRVEKYIRSRRGNAFAMTKPGALGRPLPRPYERFYPHLPCIFISDRYVTSLFRVDLRPLDTPADLENVCGRND